jgi:GMP synthase-like glutamine amidotransferase
MSERAMKPIAIFQHYPGAGPGHFLDFARRAHLPVRIFCGFLGEQLPGSIQDFSGLVSMGGPMSVNQQVDFIEQEARLIDQALALEIPILGHCLGSQLLARALGATIEPNQPASWELGWHPVSACSEQQSQWTDAFSNGDVFHWHNENFTLPPGATRLLSNAHCDNQAFVHGQHLGMQFHIEITEAMVRDWTQNSDDPQNWQHLASVQSVPDILKDIETRVARSNHMADQVYQTWSQALLNQD